MSKYDALAAHLAQRSVREHPMSFAEIESVIGSRLPASAREHRPWWANNAQSHVPRRGWLQAGFKTARVDMSNERVTFVRTDAADVASPADAERTPVRGPEGSAQPETDVIRVPLRALSASVRHLLEERARAFDGDLSAAAAAVLQDSILARRQALLAEWRALNLEGGPESAEAIRGDRDDR